MPASARHAARQATGAGVDKWRHYGQFVTERDKAQRPLRLSEYGVTSLIEGSNPSLSVLQIACTRGNSRDVGSRPVSTDKAAQPANGSVMAAVGDQRLGGAEMRELP